MHQLLFLEFDPESVKLFVLNQHYNKKSEEAIRREVHHNPDSKILLLSLNSQVNSYKVS